MRYVESCSVAEFHPVTVGVTTVRMGSASQRYAESVSQALAVLA